MPRRLFSLLAVAIVLAGCARRADVSNPRHFDNQVVSFDYPQNWKITVEKKYESIHLIQVEAPGSMITALTVYPADLSPTLEKYANDFAKNMSTAVKLGEFKLASVAVKPETADVKYSIKVANVDVPHTANFSKHALGGVSVICITQIVDEDRALMQAGFDLIRRTLAASPGK